MANMTSRQRASLMRLCELASMLKQRDVIILEAYWNDINKNQIHTITGIARTTIDRIIEKSEDRS